MKSGWKFLLTGGAALVVGLLVLLPARAAAPSRESSSTKSPILYRYVISPQRSRVSLTFRGPLAVPYDAHFRVIEGELFLGRDGSFEGAKGHIAIKTASVKSKKAEHQKMLWRDVFEAFAYPEIELRVSSIKPGGEPGSRKRRREKDWHLSARGELNLHGVERVISLVFRMADTGTDLYIRGLGRLVLSEFGMSRPRVLLLMPGSDEVEVRVRLVASPVVR